MFSGTGTKSSHARKVGLSIQEVNSLHRFIFKGKRLIYDQCSLSAFEVDKITWDILETIGRTNRLGAEFYRKYDKERVWEVLAKLTELKNKGRLFSTAKPTPPLPDNATTHLVLFVTYSCNLNCGYCFTKHEPYAGQGSFMDKETAEKSIDFLLRKSGKHKDLFINFFGGEPLLNFPVVKHAIEYAKGQAKSFGKNFQFSMTTNTVLLTKDRQSFLRENRVAIIASLDGPRDIQDGQRPARDGNSSYDRAAANLEEALQTWGPYGIYIRSTFTRHNVDCLTEMVMSMLQLGFRDISIEPVILPANHKDAIRMEDIPQVRRAYAQLAERYLQELLAHNIFLILQFTYILDLLESPFRRFARCGAAQGINAVSPTGELYPCVKLVEANEYKLGNVHDRDVDERIRDLFRSLQVQNKEKCQPCWAKYICGGGCHAHGFKYNNDLFSPNEVECHFMKCWIELGIWLYANLSKEAPDVLASIVRSEAQRRRPCPKTEPLSTLSAVGL